MTDPWAISHENHVATTALQQLVDDEPDRVTGMWMDGPQELVLSVVDRSVLDEPPFAQVREATDTAGMTIEVVAGARSWRELERISEEVRRTNST